jgi:hypothetical protein
LATARRHLPSSPVAPISYGILYRIDEAAAQIVIVAVMQLNQHPDVWRGRDRGGRA